jgi:hypothetical protein
MKPEYFKTRGWFLSQKYKNNNWGFRESRVQGTRESQIICSLILCTSHFVLYRKNLGEDKVEITKLTKNVCLLVPATWEVEAGASLDSRRSEPA